MFRQFFLLFGISLLLVSCTSEKNPSTQAPKSTVPQPAYVQKLESTSLKIRDTEEFQKCIEPTIHMCVSQTANEVARKNKSPEFCNELTDTSARDACVYGVVSTMAIDAQDPKPCDTLSDGSYKDSCRLTIIRLKARETGDIKICDGLVTSGKPNASVDQCRMEVILGKDSQDPKACDVITEGPLRTACTMNMNMRKDMKNNQKPNPQPVPSK